jgi:3'-5' exonuclease
MTMKIYCDVETIPSVNPPDPKEIQAPSNYKDPLKIQAYQAEKVDETWRKQSLDSMQGRLACIGWALEDEAPRSLTLKLDAEDERELLVQFENEILENRGGEAITWIGHNFQSFDGVWLRRKAIQNKLLHLPGLISLDRFKGNVLDTMLLWSPHDPRDRVSLDRLARFLGLGGKTEGMDGGMVWDAWQEGCLDEISAYCRDDVALVREVFRKLEQWI